MAATVTEIGTSNVSANPAATISVTTTAAVNVGEILFFVPATYSGATAVSATASAGGNAMTQDATATRGVSNVTTWLFRYEPGSTLASGSTVTATITNGGAGSVGKCIKVAGLVTGIGLDATAGTASGLSQTPSTGASGTPPSADEVFALAALTSAVATAGQAGTPANSYTALTEVVQTTRIIALYAAWKDLTAPAASQNETWTPTWGANKAWAGLIGLYRVASAAVVPPVKPRGVLNAVNRSYQW